MDSQGNIRFAPLGFAGYFLPERQVIITGERFDVCDLKDIDWNRVDNIYNQMSEISKRYLKNALNG